MKQFERYLAMLENAAPEAQKADFRKARELYAKQAGTPQMEAWWDRMFAGLGKTASRNTFADQSPEKYKGASRSDEQVKADAAKAKEIKDAEGSFDSATKTVVKVAEVDPGKVDAWVDARLKPTIERAMNSDNGFTTAEENRKAATETKKAAMAEYKAEDEAAKAEQAGQMKAALEKADKEEAERKERELADKAQEKRDALGSNTEYKYDPSMSVGSSDSDINQTVATRKSENLAKAQDADEKAKAAEKFWADEGDTPEFGKTMSAEDVKKSQEEKNRMADMADNFDKWAYPDVASVSDKGLRAAFESVYGDSRGYSDKEIRTICESCYRRRKS